MTGRRTSVSFALLLVLLTATTALAFDPATTFHQGAWSISPEFAYGRQFNLQDHQSFSDIEFVNAGLRLGWLPFRPAGPGPLFGAFEVGVQPIYQRYLEPHDAFYAGFGVTGRYHFLSLGRLVPYGEAAAFAGGTDLRVKEIDSDFAFLLWFGGGLSFFVSDRTAVYAGYRWSHVSNGNTDKPNRGFEAHTGVVGVSYFFK
jgi:hypothetical protein